MTDCYTIYFQLDSIEYGVNNDHCIGGCCTAEHIICTQNKTTPNDIKEACNGVTSCILNSDSDMRSEMITCPSHAAKLVSFAVIHYQCVEGELLTLLQDESNRISLLSSPYQATSLPDMTA